MRSKPKSPIWPYLGILACLFVLSVTAPKAWDRMAREQALGRLLAARKARSTPVTPVALPDSPSRVDTLGELAWNATPVDDAFLGPRGEEPAAPAPAEVPPPEAPATIEPPAPVETAAPAPSPVEPIEVVPQVTTADTTSDEEAPTASEPEAPEAVAEPQPATRWPLPRTLQAQLDRLEKLDPKAKWIAEARVLIERLCAQPAGDSATAKTLAQLRSIAGRLERDSGNAERAVEIERARVRYALARWIDLWDSALAWERVADQKSPASASNARLAASLSEVEALTRKGAAGTAWAKYLQLDKLRALESSDGEEAIALRRKVAQSVLDRLEATRLTTAQRKFVAKEPLASFVSALRPWAAEAVPATQVLTHVEEFEYSNLPSDAERLARDWHGLTNSDGPEAAALSRSVNLHYRNANVRAAVSGELLNRLVPQPKAVKGSVRDTVLDVPVHGCSTTFTKLSVQLVPNDNVIRMNIQGDGRVSSDTVATSGPASFRSQGQSSFQVHKPVQIGPDGMTVWPAQAQAENNYNQLVAMETQFDGVPLVGSLVRSIALSRHDDSQGDAMAEVGQKVAHRARTQFDSEVKPHLTQAAEKLQSRQAAAIERLGLELVPLAMSSTEDRMVARARLGAGGQLGSHTPRPQAPSNSWFSLQLHQSALNNVFEKLDLDGRTFTLAELFSWIGDKLNRSEWASREELPEGVRMTFAPRDAIRVRALDGRVEVKFAFAELTQGRNRWRNFAVRTYYVPEAEGLDALLTRDPNDTIHLEGKSVKGVQVALRTIFSKVLSHNRDLHLVTETFIKDPRLSDLEVAQYVVEDGWIGLAYSPKRQPASTARKPGAAQR